MRKNYVFIDYENVQPERLSSLDQDHFKVMVFVGASQTRLAFESAAALQRMGSKAEYVKISGNGSNALDFHKERLDLVVTKLQQLAASKPCTLKTLSSTIGSLFQKQLAEEEVASLVSELQSRSLIAVAGTKVSYTLPAPGA